MRNIWGKIPLWVKITAPNILLWIITLSVIKGDLWKYPFDVNLWGNVTSWISTLGTIITIIYVSRTFKSQSKLLQLELDKSVAANMPVFNAIQTKILENKQTLQLTCIKNHSQSVILNVNNYPLAFSTDEVFNLKLVNNSSDDSDTISMAIGDLFEGETKSFSINILGTGDVPFYFSLLYFDIDRRQQYIQYFLYTFPSRKINKHTPIRFSETTNLIGSVVPTNLDS